MRTTLTKALCLGLIAGWVVTSTSTLCAQPTNAKPAAPAAETKAKSKHLPLIGTIASLDKQNKTVTLEGPKKTTIQVTSQTKIKKAGQPAVFDDLAVGEKVTGSRHEVADGKWEATSLSILGKTEKTKPKDH